MKFKDITDKNAHVIAVMRSSGIKGKNIKIYEYKGTQIIFSFDEAEKHISISNLTRKIKKSEIDYAIIHIMKAKKSEVQIFATKSGIIHIHHSALN